MAIPRGRIVPVLIVAAAGAVVVGVAAVADRIAAARDRKPAPPETPQLGGRLPVGLWPADGSEPIVEGGIRGWRRMAAHLYHRDTAIDDAARARAIVLATYSRRAADARRAVAFEVSVIRGAHEPAVIAAAWLVPQVPGPDAVVERRGLREFGIGEATIAILEAAESLGADGGRLAPEWGRQVGLDPARRDFGAVDAAGLDDVGRARLAALMIDAAMERIHARG